MRKSTNICFELISNTCENKLQKLIFQLTWINMRNKLRTWILADWDKHSLQYYKIKIYHDDQG